MSSTFGAAFNRKLRAGAYGETTDTGADMAGVGSDSDEGDIDEPRVDEKRKKRSRERKAKLGRNQREATDGGADI